MVQPNLEGSLEIRLETTALDQAASPGQTRCLSGSDRFDPDILAPSLVYPTQEETFPKSKAGHTSEHH